MQLSRPHRFMIAWVYPERRLCCSAHLWKLDGHDERLVMEAARDAARGNSPSPQARAHGASSCTHTVDT